MLKKSLQVLLIEDNPIDRQIFVSLTKKMDLELEVEWAQSLGEAQAALKNRSFDLIVSDLGLPDSEGMECLARVKDASRGTPVIILTSSDDDALLEEASHIGVYDYLVKDDLTSGILRRSFRYAISRTEAERENKRLEAQIEHNQKIEALGQLTGGIAHDFNNKLAIIKGNLQIIKVKHSRQQSIDQNLKNIDKTVDISAQLTKQLLAFARKQELSRQGADLTQIVEQSLGLLQRLTKKNIKVVRSGSSDPLYAEVDFAQIDQVLMNLLINARDAIGEKRGVISVNVDSVVINRDNDNELSAIPRGQYACITVQDNGCGMDSELQAKILQPFFTTKEKDKGTGLGLSVVDGIISQLGGFMEIESEPGVGTTIKLFFVEQELEVSESLVSVAQPSQGDPESMVVLYAEDEEDLRDLTKILLEDVGFTVLVARNGQEGLQLFEQYQDVIDVVLTDAIMPEMGGKELMSQVRLIDPEVGFIFLSGYSETELSSSGDFPENTLFHPKPCEFQDLVHSLRSIGGDKDQSLATGDPGREVS